MGNSSNDNTISQKNIDGDVALAQTLFAHGSKTEKFVNIVFPSLAKLGWTIQHRKRKSDYYIFPPGINEENHVCRKDYFDSLPQTLSFIETNEKWNKCTELMDAIKTFDEMYPRTQNKEPKKNMKQESKDKSTKPTKTQTFVKVVFPSLAKLGWTMTSPVNDVGKPLYFPPGIDKENHVCRKDYFDAISQTLSFIETNETYNKCTELMDAIKTFDEMYPRTQNKEPKKKYRHGRNVNIVHSTKENMKPTKTQTFVKVVFPSLAELGWTMTPPANDVGKPLFFPPGIDKENHVCRKDYFDAISQTLLFIKKNEKWNKCTELMDAIKTFDELYLRSHNSLKDKFVEHVLPILKEFRWEMKQGSRSTDYYIFPPGIDQRNHVKRKDYFDSIKQTISYIEAKKKWNKNSRLMDAIKTLTQSNKRKNKDYQNDIDRDETPVVHKKKRRENHNSLFVVANEFDMQLETKTDDTHTSADDLEMEEKGINMLFQVMKKQGWVLRQTSSANSFSFILYDRKIESFTTTTQVLAFIEDNEELKRNPELMNVVESFNFLKEEKKIQDESTESKKLDQIDDHKDSSSEPTKVKNIRDESTECKKLDKTGSTQKEEKKDLKPSATTADEGNACEKLAKKDDEVLVMEI